MCGSRAGMFILIPFFCWIPKYLLQKTMFSDHQEAPKLLEVEGVSSSLAVCSEGTIWAPVLEGWEPSFYVVQCYFRHLDEGKAFGRDNGRKRVRGSWGQGSWCMQPTGDRWFGEHGDILSFILHWGDPMVSWVTSGLYTHWIVCHPKYPFLKDTSRPPPAFACSHKQLNETHVKSQRNDLWRLLTLQLRVKLSKAPSSHARASRLWGWNKNPSSWLMLLLLYMLTQMLIFLSQREKRMVTREKIISFDRLTATGIFQFFPLMSLPSHIWLNMYFWGTWIPPVAPYRKKL